jgi:hypothetical protein
MDANIDDSERTRVFTTKDGRAVIEQSGNSIGLSADEILAVIKKLHLCYDYCAAWKETMSDDTVVDAEVDT